MSMLNVFKYTRFFRMVLVNTILIIVIIINPQHVFDPLRTGLNILASPFERVFSGIGFHVGLSLDFLRSIGHLKDENSKLAQENVRLIAENAKFTDMQKENDFLRQQMELLPRGSYSLTAAEVIGMDQKNIGNTITINKGSSQGVVEGMVAIVNQGVVVGKVTEVSAYTSHITLIMSPDSIISASDTMTEARGILRGRYGVSVIMDTVLQSEKLNVGDLIVTSGLGGDFPRGLLLGKIASVYPASDHLFQEATLTPFINFSQLKTVFLIKN